MRQAKVISCLQPKLHGHLLEILLGKMTELTKTMMVPGSISLRAMLGMGNGISLSSSLPMSYSEGGDLQKAYLAKMHLSSIAPLCVVPFSTRPETCSPRGGEK